MALPSLDLTEKIKDVLGHTRPLPAVAATPILHYDHTASVIWSSLSYVRKVVSACRESASVMVVGFLLS